MAEARRLALAHVMDIGHLGDAAHFLELGLLAALCKVVLELERAVEVVLQAPLAPPGDDKDVRYPDRHSLLDHVLDGRFVNEGQHFLRLGLRSRQEAGPQAGGGDHGFTELVCAMRAGLLVRGKTFRRAAAVGR